MDDFLADLVGGTARPGQVPPNGQYHRLSGVEEGPPAPAAAPAASPARRVIAGVECPHCNGTGRVSAETMGGRLRALRMERGLSYQDVSQAVGGIISVSNLGQVECGKNEHPKLEALYALASLFGVSAGWLLDGDRPD
jgi:DNA-binding XRE family transcriptional regulator